LDMEVHNHIADIAEMKEKRSICDEGQVAEGQVAWFRDIIERLKGMQDILERLKGTTVSSETLEAVELLRKSMVDVASDELKSLRNWMGEGEEEHLEPKGPPSDLAAQHVIDTSSSSTSIAVAN